MSKRNKQAAIMVDQSNICIAATIPQLKISTTAGARVGNTQNVQHNVCAKCIGSASSLLLACNILLVMLRLTTIFQIKSHAPFGPDSQIVT